MAVRPELIIGFVAPTGSDYDTVIPTVSSSLTDYGYAAKVIRLSDILGSRARLEGRLGSQDADRPDRRTELLQDEGNLLQERSGKPEAVSLLAVNEIRRARSAASTEVGDEQRLPPLDGVAHVIWSLKTPAEVALLRAIYRERFFLVSIYTPSTQRKRILARRIADNANHFGNPSPAHESRAAALIGRDESDVDAGQFGQNVRATYPLADFFVDSQEISALTASIRRCLDIIVGDPFATPTRSEYAMFIAEASALRSAELGRQVGAAIVSQDGDVVATGTNEVPAPGGGHYWQGDTPDRREFTRGTDTSDDLRSNLTAQIAEELRAAGLLIEGSDADRAIPELMRRTRLRDLTEFGRAVHAEMSALLDATRRGVSVRGHDMHVTTFPCHQCARHIIAAGIARVFYIHPYTKSLAETLHGDALSTPESGSLDASRVPFAPFVGVAPRRYLQAFSMPTRRKLDTGAIVSQDRRVWTPRWTPEDPEGLWEGGSYIVREEQAVTATIAMIAELSTIEEQEAATDGT
jgi:cytidine deaminase